MSQKWLESKYNVKGVTLNIQPEDTNTILGHQTKTLAGRNYIVEFITKSA